MNTTILTVEIRYEQDVVQARQRTRQIAEGLGFDAQDQTRIATAVSEIARNALEYANGGRVEFSLSGEVSQIFLIQIQDRGKGIADLPMILEGRYRSTTGMGLGIVGAQRLMDRFEIESTEQGTRVLMGKMLPRQGYTVTGDRLSQITDELVQASPQNPFEEIQRQNQELLQAMEELRRREEALTQLNRELEDTNRGVVALYAELDEKANSLQKASELKTRFFSNMSHEFRTPLNSIVSLTRLLMDRLDGDLTSEQEKQVLYIRKAAEGLRELIDDLLDMAKVEAGKVEVQTSEFAVSDLFGTLRGMLRPLLAANASVVLIFEPPSGIPPLRTDEAKVAQILRNLISNALKFTEQGEIRVAATLTGSIITFTVSDTGIGIALEDQERIFEDFVQLESPLQRRVKGTGLGLPLSRRLAELLGGKLWVNSSPGVGSTFSVALPLVYAGGGEISPVTQLVQLDPTRRPVLVLKDDAQTYEQYLQGSCYQCIPARSLVEAKQALQICQPVAIVLDIQSQPERAGELLPQLKQNLDTQKMPILVITAIDQQQGVNLESEACLNKPVDRLFLLNKINKLVNREQQQTLLLIDDNEVARYLFKQLTSELDLVILEAPNGQAGIELAQRETPQAIVLDLSMPEVSGAEVLNTLKRHPVMRQIPVIIQTAKSLEPEERSALTPHTVAILSKQSPPEVAIARLKEALIEAGLALEV